MGYFRNINLNNFRNFNQYSLDFNSSCNIIIGKNGCGKTNILEGISLFEKGRGFKKEKIKNLNNFHNKDSYFVIHSIFQNKNINYDLKVINSITNFKKTLINDNFDKDSLNHLDSMFSIIYFLPEMERLFNTTPSIRRNFLDRLIFNFDKNYNLIVNKYKKMIIERQLLLKKNILDESWITKIEFNIADLGILIYKKRLEHINNINKILKNISSKPNIYNNYLLNLQDDLLLKNPEILNNNDIYLSELLENRKKDFFSGGCTVGPHRSDLIGYDVDTDFNLNQLSTGQQKTMILLIIISQCKYLFANTKIQPIILLDEVCSHLDGINRDLLLYLINELKVQVFMTGTEESFFSFLSTKANYCNIY